MLGHWRTIVGTNSGAKYAGVIFAAGLGVSLGAMSLLVTSSHAAPVATVATTSEASVAALRKRLAFVFNDEHLRKTTIGAEVFSLSRQEALFKLNAEKALSPASSIKLLTAVTALRRLGPNFVYRTSVHAGGPIVDGVLRGDLYVKADGDPSLVTERMYLLVNEIARTGVKSITGSIVVDDWTFDQVRLDPNRLAATNDRAYNAPVGALNFNYNTTTVFFRPGANEGDKVNVFVEPDTGYIETQNLTRTGKRGSGFHVVASRVKGNRGDKMVVRGTMALGMGEARSFFNITEPVQYAGQALRTMLGARGIKVVGTEIKHEIVPAGARSIATLESLPLRDIVTLMNKFSNNFIAETLVKTLGREVKGAPGTMEKGLQVLGEEATRLGMNQAGFRVVSGSGLTRENHVSAEQFILLLNGAFLEFDVLPELLTSMPIAGRDGTLHTRMKGTAAYGRLRGKTGTLDGVSSIVGVVQSRGGELLAFAVIMNDKGQASASMRTWQNYFAQALADFNRKAVLSERPSPLPDTMESTTEARGEAKVENRADPSDAGSPATKDSAAKISDEENLDGKP